MEEVKVSNAVKMVVNCNTAVATVAWLRLMNQPNEEIVALDSACCAA